MLKKFDSFLNKIKMVEIDKERIKNSQEKSKFITK